MAKIQFLTTADVIALHDVAMEMADQQPTALVRPEGLESAVAQARNVAWYMDASPSAVAVHLTIAIAMAHPWVDGNKRTAAMAGVQLAGLNGSKDPTTDEYIQFATLLIKYIEAEHDARETVLGEFVESVDGWFGEG